MKKKNKNKKIVSIIIFFLVILFSINTVFADSITQNFSGKSSGLEGSDKVKSILGEALNIVRIVGSGIAVIMLLALGCKYMLASAGDKAEIKKYAVTYVIGAIVLFAASSIIGILQRFVTSTLQ